MRHLLMGLILAIALGACGGTEPAQDSAQSGKPSQTREQSKAVTVESACITPWGKKNLRALSEAEAGFGIGAPCPSVFAGRADQGRA